VSNGNPEVIVALSASAVGGVSFPAFTQLGGLGLANPTRLRVVDADGDGGRDVLVASSDPSSSPSSSLRILFGAPTQFPTIGEPLGPTPGAGRAIDVVVDRNFRRFAVAATPEGELSAIELSQGAPLGDVRFSTPAAALILDAAAVGAVVAFTASDGSVLLVDDFDALAVASTTSIAGALAPTAVPGFEQSELGLLTGSNVQRIPVLESTLAPAEICDIDDPFGRSCPREGACLELGAGE
jgi:hypothetical protein